MINLSLSQSLSIGFSQSHSNFKEVFGIWVYECARLSVYFILKSGLSEATGSSELSGLSEARKPGQCEAGQLVYNPVTL